MKKLNIRKKNRLKKYDYSTNGWYFITICSYGRSNIFGECNENVGAALVSARDKIQLSIIGQIIDNQWNNIKNNYENIESNQYIIMPNRIHGILIIDKREDARPSPTISVLFVHSNQNARLNT